VDLDRATQLLVIDWEEGHRSAYPGAVLRWACPCAECRGEGFGTVGRLDRVTELPPDDATLTGVTLVGNYALSLAFASGHATGIYTFRLLRSLCPCVECGRIRGD
jgi:DUF971 family protein